MNSRAQGGSRCRPKRYYRKCKCRWVKGGGNKRKNNQTPDTQQPTDTGPDNEHQSWGSWGHDRHRGRTGGTGGRTGGPGGRTGGTSGRTGGPGGRTEGTGGRTRGTGGRTGGTGGRTGKGRSKGRC
ncbi:hypothetical protein [Cohnella boryungensis]|uniref:Uncharacterized protein n=1 Tax=Cohnella boryungensis TaxID=768479 RepID=A0ABV8SF64_9BACL